MTTIKSTVIGSGFFALLILWGMTFGTPTAAAQVVDVPPEPPEEEMRKKHHHGGIHISVRNEAVVENEIETKANTGYNLADGSYGGFGGDGGSIANGGGEQDVEGATTGTGGTGGNADLGGAVQTGDATAETSVDNTVNSNRIGIDNCACEATSTATGTDEKQRSIRTRVHNLAAVGNGVRTLANTGDNEALGSYGGDAGSGGHIANRGHGHADFVLLEEGDESGDQEVDDSTTGAGGDGGAGSAGGSVLTGVATTRTIMANLINSNVIRVRN